MDKSNLESSLLERAFPRAEREEIDRQWVEFHVDEINCLGDRIRFLQADGSAEAAAVSEVRARVAEILAALGWNREMVVRWTWEVARRPMEFPEDVFGPATILSELDDRERVKSWIAGLSAEARAMLAETGFELEKK